VILVAAVPLYACYYFVRDTLGLQWRRWLTDQRIAEDVNSFTSQSLYFLMVGLGAVIDLVAFTGVLWPISRRLIGLNFRRQGYCYARPLEAPVMDAVISTGVVLPN